MAAAPVKSRSLHNFSLPRLRWAHCNPRVRRRNSPDPQHHQVPTTPPNADLDPGNENMDRSLEPQNRNCVVVKKEKDDVLDDGEGIEAEAMPWKLRPRRVANLQMGSFNKVQKVFDERGSKNVAAFPPNCTRVRGTAAEGGGGHRKAVEEKKRLWISLSKEEIEEDIYALTGARPSRRPRKRARNVQKLIDNVYPGSYLVGMSVDSFRIPDPCGFHTCVGCSGEKQTPDWYKEQGLEMFYEDPVTGIDIEKQMLTTNSGKLLKYGSLIIATGCASTRFGFRCAYNRDAH